MGCTHRQIDKRSAETQSGERKEKIRSTRKEEERTCVSNGRDEIGAKSTRTGWLYTTLKWEGHGRGGE